MIHTKPKFKTIPDVSFLIPTNRYSKHPDIVHTCIKSIKNASIGLNIEILVFSQDEIIIDGVTWIKENKRSGPLFGFNKLGKMASGKYLACLTDDVHMVDHISNSIEFIETKAVNWEYKVCGFNIGGSCSIPTPKEIQALSGYSVVRFPFLTKDCFKKLSSNIFHPDLFYHAGDIWLSYFLAMNNNPTVEAGARIKQTKHLKDATFEKRDVEKTFELMKNFTNTKRYI